MRDFVGREIEPGDLIVVAAAHGRNAGASLVKGCVVRLTPQMVVYAGSDYSGYDNREHKASPSKVVVVQKFDGSQC